MVTMLYAGENPTWYTSKVRKAGAKLKTFGVSASGPAPLEDLFRFTVAMFKGAQGRKLSSIECHDLMFKIGEVVVVGGVGAATTTRPASRAGPWQLPRPVTHNHPMRSTNRLVSPALCAPSVIPHTVTALLTDIITKN